MRWDSTTLSPRRLQHASGTGTGITLTGIPILEDRLLWRAQTFRHMVHLLPGQTILEIGCGQGMFTSKLHRVSRGENAITAVTFVRGRIALNACQTQ